MAIKRFSFSVFAVMSLFSSTILTPNVSAEFRQEFLEESSEPVKLDPNVVCADEIRNCRASGRPGSRACDKMWECIDKCNPRKKHDVSESPITSLYQDGITEEDLYQSSQSESDFDTDYDNAEAPYFNEYEAE